MSVPFKAVQLLHLIWRYLPLICGHPASLSRLLYSCVRNAAVGMSGENQYFEGMQRN